MAVLFYTFISASAASRRVFFITKERINVLILTTRHLLSRVVLSDLAYLLSKLGFYQNYFLSGILLL